MSHIFPSKSWRSTVLFCGLLIVSLFVSSCTQTVKYSHYKITFDCNKVTQPMVVEMLAGRDVKESLLQIVDDVNNLKSRVDRSWPAEIVNDRFDAEDRYAEYWYNENLPKVKEFEAQCRKKIEEMDPNPKSHFCLSVVYKLTRSVPGDGKDVCLNEYRFDLKY